MNSELLSQNVQNLIDIEEIKRLHLGYVYALNSLQWDVMLDCFTENAIIDLWDHGVCKGKKEIETQLRSQK